MDAIKTLENANLSPALLQDRSAYIKATRQGIPGSIVKEIATASGERELLIKILNTSSANLNRFYKVEVLNPQASENILDLLRIFDLATKVFGDAEKAQMWLHTDIPALNGESPIELCDTHEGRNLVREALFAIEYGEFS